MRLYPGTADSARLARLYGATPVDIEPGIGGLDTFDNPPETGGDQCVVADSEGQLIAFHCRRDYNPSVYRRVKPVGDRWFGPPEACQGLPQVNGFSVLVDGEIFWALGGSWPNEAGNTRLYKSTDWGLNWTQQAGTYTFGVNRPGTIDAAGNLIFPVHVGNPSQVRRLVSYDHGAIWIPEVVSYDAYMTEPSCIAINGSLLWVARNEEPSVWYPPYMLWQGYDDFLPIPGIPEIWRLGGSPPLLVDLKDGRYLLQYAHGQDSKFIELWESKNGVDWTLLGRPNAEHTGTVDAHRYGAISPDGTILLGEPDNGGRAAQEFRVRFSPSIGARFGPGTYTCYLSAPMHSTLEQAIVMRSYTSGTRWWIHVYDAVDRRIASWQVGPNGAQLFSETQAGLQYTQQDLRLNREYLLSIEAPEERIARFYLNNRYLTWGAYIDPTAGPPAKVVLSIEDAVIDMTEQRVWA